MRQRPRGARGFSLIEIIVVMGIITLIAGIAMPVMSKRLTRVRTSETRTELALVGPAVMDYFEDTGSFPPSFDDLESNRARVDGWAGPYARALMTSQANSEMSLSKDAWNRDYDVLLDGDSELTISSLGPDGEAGTSDDIELVVDVTPLRRAHTRAELSILNAAIASWNAEHLPDQHLPGEIDDLLETLAEDGYLPEDDPRFESDGWGRPYVIDPPGSSPVIGVGSSNLLARAAEDEDEDDGNNGQGNDDGNNGDNGKKKKKGR